MLTLLAAAATITGIELAGLIAAAQIRDEEKRMFWMSVGLGVTSIIGSWVAYALFEL